ncbi:hypothetical protein vseg_007509 [Gypsophila vaccaria]
MSTIIARHHPPEFDGTGGPAALEDWTRCLGKQLSTVGCPDALRVDQAVYYLKGVADMWWYNNQDQLTLYHKAEANGEESFGWSSFKKSLRDEFFPEHLRHAKRTKLDSFKQEDGISVEEYYIKFMELSAFSTDLKMSDEVLAARFERGLDIHHLEKMSAGVPSTVRDVYLKVGHV